MSPLLFTLTWIGIALCIVQSGIFAGLNLAVFSVSRLRLEVEAAAGRQDAVEVLELRRDGNLTLATILWGNVTINVLLTLLADSVLAGVGAFLFSTFAITFFGEIVPQAYFARHAVHMAARLAPLLRLYRRLLFPLAKPSAMFLNWWLGPEGIALLRERDFRALITRHSEAAGGELGVLEGIGALNFLDLDDIVVADEGEAVDPRSVIPLPVRDGRPQWPQFARSPDDPFLRRIDASGKKWAIIADDASGNPVVVIHAHHFLRDVLFDRTPVEIARYCHRPIVIADPHARLGDVIGRMKVRPEHPEDDVIDDDLILIWASDVKRVITGADLLGRLLRGITTSEAARQ
jgi:CBS domain containing-hemolysin-like protein